MKITHRFLSIQLLIILSIIWGSSFILIKKSLLSFSPFQVGSLRIMISGLALLPYVIIKYKKAQIEVKVRHVIVFGLLEIGIPPYLYAIAQTALDSSTAGILNSLVPLFTLLTGVFFFSLKFRLAKLSGVLIGLLGALLLLAGNAKSGSLEGFSFHFSNLRGLFIVAATIMYGFGGNVLKQYLQEVDGLLVSGLSFVIFSIPAGLILCFSDLSRLDFSTRSGLISWGAIIILSILGSALAIFLYTLLVQTSNALFASFVTYFIPFIALLWGIMDGEAPSIISFIALFCIILGVYLINRKSNNRVELI